MSTTSATDLLLQSGSLSDSGSLSFLRYHLKERLLDRIRTGDVLYDTLISYFIISSQGLVSGYSGSLRTWLKLLLGKLKKALIYLIYRHSMVLKTATVQYITEDRQINVLFEPVQWYLYSKTDTVKEPRLSLVMNNKNSEIFSQIPRMRESKVKFGNYEIAYSIISEEMVIYGDKEYKRENTIINLSTMVATNSNENLFHDFTTMCKKEFDLWQSKKDWKQMIYRNVGDDWKSSLGRGTRRLDTVILKEDQMHAFMKDLNSFITGEELYLSRDIPYTRRYLLHGPPGTGKSSLIKAIACHTKRHIHHLVFSQIESPEQLFTLLGKIDFKTTILVMEDIDRATEAVKKVQLEKIKEEDKVKEKDDDKKKKKIELTESDILNAIDGNLIDSYGQILIVTSNHPEQLSEAFLRPGRIDWAVELSRCNNYQIGALYKNFFSEDPPTNCNLASGYYSPAEIVQILIRSYEDREKAWKVICNGEKLK